MKCVSIGKNLVPNEMRWGKTTSAKHSIWQYAMREPTEFERLIERPKSVPVLGSEEGIYFVKDDGLFSSILNAYNNHWNLRTSPDDWWFCVTRRVALAIDENAKKDSVRKLFVNHEGKKALNIAVRPENICDVNYSWFFDEISTNISKDVKVPEYVEAVTADFSVTTPVQKIVSQVTVMSSFQEFYEFRITLGCGIPGIEMVGSEEDWMKLQSKLRRLKAILEPIENDIGLTAKWWSHVEKVFKKLLDTYKGKPDKRWWSRIVSEKPFGSFELSGHYRGWIAQFLTGKKKLRTFPSGIVTVPLIMGHPSGMTDTAALAAGMLGFTLDEDGMGGVPSVRPFQGWCLILRVDSPFRQVSAV